MAGWHHRLIGQEFGWTPGVGDGQGGLACCNSWGGKESDTAEQLNWTELISSSIEQSRISRDKITGNDKEKNPEMPFFLLVLVSGKRGKEIVQTMWKEETYSPKTENKRRFKLSSTRWERKKKIVNKVILNTKNSCPVTNCTEKWFLIKFVSYSEFFSEQFSHLYFSSCRLMDSSWQPHWCKREKRSFSHS